MRRSLIGWAGLLAALSALIVLLGSGSGAAARGLGEPGATKGHPRTGSQGIAVSVAELAARQQREDRRTGGRPRGINQKPEPGERQQPPELPEPAALQPSVGEPVRNPVGPSAPFPANASFLGAQLNESGFVPPDSMGSIGPTQALVAVNGRIKAFSKTGVLGALNVDDLTFWNSVRDGQDVSDPGVEYDRLSKRWIVSAINLANTNNRIMIAVSSGPAITGTSSFTFYFFPSNSSGQFADYPQMGVDRNAIYIGTNDFSRHSANTSAFVIRKSTVTGGGPIVVTAFHNLVDSTGAGPWAPQPAHDMDPNMSQGYFIGVDFGLFSRLDVRRVSDPGGTPTMSGNLAVSVPTTYFPLNVPAQGTSTRLDPLDDRLFEAMIARKPNGTLSLWTAHNIRVNSSGVGGSGGDRTADRWYEIGSLNTTPGLIQSGTTFDPAASNPRFFWIPSIAANGQGHASLNSSTAGVGRFAEVASMGRLATDLLGNTRPFTITQSSSSPYNVTASNPQRWGDYSQTVVDPNDNMTFWTFQEYANATDSWGVRVIRLRAPPPATPSSASPSSVPQGSSSASVTITGTRISGSGFFDPGPDTGGPGFPKHIAAAGSGGVTVNSVTYTNPTHVVLNLNTTAASAGGQTVTITNPDGQKRAACLIQVGEGGTPCQG